MPNIVSKQPSESFIYDFRFYDTEGVTDFIEGETITQVLSIVSTAKGIVGEVDPVVISGIVHDSDKIVQARLTGGTDGEKYNLSCIAVTSLGNIAETDGTLRVKNIT